jgi:hypothetical protein
MAAANFLYDRVRLVHRIRAWLTVGLAVLGTLVVLAISSPSVAGWATAVGPGTFFIGGVGTVVKWLSLQKAIQPAIFLIGGAAIFINWLIRQWEQNLATTAARVHESYETELFRLRWNNSLVGPKPAAVDVAAATRQYKGEINQFKNRYEDPGPLGHDFGVLVCQQATCAWARSQDWIYAKVVLGLTATLFVAFVLLALLLGMTVGDYLSKLLVPALAAYLLGLDTFQDLRRGVDTRKRLESEATGLIDAEVETPGSLTKDALRDLQDGIFVLRTRAAGVPRMFYNRLRAGFERDRKKTIDDIKRRAHV